MMARISQLKIIEDTTELKKLLKNQTKHKNIDRLNTLIYILEKRFATRDLLSKFIGVSRRTLERWLSDYTNGGIQNMLLCEIRERKSHLIPEEVDEGLKHRVEHSEQGFASYVEAQQWIASEYNLELKYNTVREHLIRHYKTKVKSPRKSHVKKDKEAIEAFLKTT